MEFERIKNGVHRGYTMPHREYMEDHGLKYDNLNERLKSRIRLFEDKYDESLNNDGYLDENEETGLLTESTKIHQEMKTWYEKKDKDENDGAGKVAVGVTLGLFGFVLLAIGIKNINQ